ncbi:MAG: hypothetical protein GY725_01300 [bacterium]|nr:hypothetical protein [bacterium]
MSVDGTEAKNPIDPEQLVQLMETADRLVVRESPEEESSILFESNNRADLEALARCLGIEIPEEGIHCMCSGSPAIYLYRDEEELVELTNHHGFSLRCSLWDSDAIIANTEKWLSWFDVHGMDGPRREVEALQVQEAEQHRNWEKWAGAMPACISEVWNGMIEQCGGTDFSILRNALEAALPAKEDQIRSLFGWYGSGAGPWSGFPSYENTAGELLLGYEISELIGAFDIASATPEMTEGAARLFGGFEFFRRHPEGIHLVPREIKAVFWAFVKDTPDEDKLGRAQRAFAEAAEQDLQ